MNISAVLLAGGESHRMGRDKATMLFRGERLWQHQTHLLRSLAPIEILISARTKPQWQPAGTTFVPDDLPSRGPLSGLAAGLQVMRGTHLLGLAIDMPVMTRSCLISLCDQIAPHCGVLPHIGRRAEPLAAVYPRECLPWLNAALAGTDFSLQSVSEVLVERNLLRRFKVSPAEEHCFRNLNRPADVDALEYATD